VAGTVAADVSSTDCVDNKAAAPRATGGDVAVR
jgi:hypothetical protein